MLGLFMYLIRIFKEHRLYPYTTIELEALKVVTRKFVNN